MPLIFAAFQAVYNLSPRQTLLLNFKLFWSFLLNLSDDQLIKKIINLRLLPFKKIQDKELRQLKTQVSIKKNKTDFQKDNYNSSQLLLFANLLRRK